MRSRAGDESQTARGLGALAAAVLVLAGCPRGESGAAPPRATVSVAAASDLQFALAEVVSAFRAARPEVAVEVTWGSSGSFYAQLVNRAPFDLFLSADVSYARRLFEAGHAPEAPFVYAYGRLVVWAPRSSPLDVEALGAQALLDPRIRTVAIANPQHAPYGRAAEAALRSLGLHAQVAPKLVLGENVAQAAQLVDTGNADAGVFALSLALSPPLRERGRSWRVPDDAYPRLEQGGVVLGWARDPAATRELQRFLTGPEGRAILERFGFGLPPE